MAARPRFSNSSHEHCDRTGYPPTVREIGNAVGSGVPVDGACPPGQAGRVRLPAPRPLQAARNACQSSPADRIRRASRQTRHAGLLPLVGAVAAGLPRLADEQVEDWVQTPFAADFALRVTGESMRDAGILDGDVVAVRRQDTAENGQIIVAMIGDEATVKTFQRREDHVLLIACEPGLRADRGTRGLPGCGPGRRGAAHALARAGGGAGRATLAAREPGSRGSRHAARGKSGHHRAGCWLTASEGNLRESATETKQPRSLFAATVKRCGKSAPAAW